MKVTWFLSDTIACGHVRAEVIAREVNKQYPNCDMVCKTEVLASDFVRSNVMVFQRQDSADMLAKLRAAKQRGIRTIYEIDDDLLNIPPEFQKPYMYYSRPDVRQRIIEFLGAPDAITVSTPQMAQAIKPYTHGIQQYVVENAIDAEMWEPAFAERMARPDDGRVTIGWMASGSHILDAPLVVPALVRLMAEHPNLCLHLIGWVGWEQLGAQMGAFKERIHTEPWIDSYHLPWRMNDIDIGLCPLKSNVFNDSKSNIKWQQYAVLGACPVVSASPAYDNVQNGRNGFVVNSPDGWYSTLKNLIVSDKARKVVGMNARKDVLDKWDIRNRANAWVWVFGKVLEK